MGFPTQREHTDSFRFEARNIITPAPVSSALPGNSKNHDFIML